MVGIIVADKWFANIWTSSRRSISREPERQVLGVMAFEISKLMSKLVSLWQSLCDKQIVSFRQEIANSFGIRNLVSENEDYLMELAFSEIIENWRSVAKAVSMLGKKCVDPRYHNLDRLFNEEDDIDPNWYGWRFTVKEMEKKVKKMEGFVVATEQLYQELEVLAELEQSVRRIHTGSDSSQVELLGFQQKVMRQCQEVKNLGEMSPWVRSYDYIVRFILRFIFTMRVNIYEQQNCCCILNRSNSLGKMSVHPSEINIFNFAVPLGRSFSSLGLGGQKSKLKNVEKSHSHSRSTLFNVKQYPEKRRIFKYPAGFTGCMADKSESSRKNSTKTKDILYRSRSPDKMMSFSSIKSRPLDAPPSTLGYAALALRYANIIILIEKLASSPNLISLDAKDDLYNMLPTSIKSFLRAKLKTFSRNLGYNADFAAEWSLAIVRILEWLSPLAHDTLRWQSERKFERQRLSFGSSVRLVQTLYFARQVETDAAIVELLVGLVYLCRFSDFGDKLIRKRNGSLRAVMLYRV